MEVIVNYYRGGGEGNLCNGLFRFIFKKYIEKQFLLMRGKIDICV